MLIISIIIDIVLNLKMIVKFLFFCYDKFIFRRRANFVGTASNPAEKNRAKPEKQKGKKEGGWGEGIFALLRLRIERFRFSLIKRKPKQKIFHLLLKEKNGGQKKLKNVMKKFLFWFAVAERRQAETHQQNYQFSRSVRFRSEPSRARRVVSRGSVQKRLEFQPKGTAIGSPK